MEPELLYFINQCTIGTECLFKISCCRVWNLLCVYWDHTLSGSYSTGTAESREWGFCGGSQCPDTGALTRECPKLILQVPAAWGEQPRFSAESWIQTLCGSDPDLVWLRSRGERVTCTHSLVTFSLLCSDLMLNASKSSGKEKFKGKNILYCVERKCFSYSKNIFNVL